MSKRTLLLIVALVLVGVGLWAGGAMLWERLLQTHGRH
jgi:hypothetical protein